ncbi:MAG: class I SAM-dependent methyltransferase [Rhodopila sp.]|nr:class I SAM-dependent methyltransferase [Rhodopila sp.]
MDALTADQIARIRTVSHFKDSRDAAQNLGVLYISYVSAFVDLLKIYPLARKPRVIADIGTGYGWLAIALARQTDARIIAVDNDGARMNAARKIADILGVEHRIDWRIGALPHLPIADQEADVTFCVEVIEHVDNRPEIVRELGRVTRDHLVVTSPNRNFPIIRHDTGLPFCHWLPAHVRDWYAALCGRSHLQHGNLFWSPGMVSAALPEFERASRFLQFLSVKHFFESEVQIYNAARIPTPMTRLARRLVLGACGLLGKNAIHLSPNLASTFRRTKGQRSEPLDQVGSDGECREMLT